MSFGSLTIKVSVSVLIDAAEKIHSYAEDTADVFDRLANHLNRISGHAGWEGSSMIEIQAATEKNQKTYNETVIDLENLAGFLEKYAIEMQAKDVDIKSEIDSV